MAKFAEFLFHAIGLIKARGGATGGETEQPPTKRSPENARWHLRALFRIYLTLRRHSFSESALERGASLLTAPPRRIEVASTVVGDLDLSSPVGFDSVDLGVGSGSSVVAVGYPLAAGRVGRCVVGGTIVGNWDLSSPTGFDRVDLEVSCGAVLSLVGYPFAIGRIGTIVVGRSVVCELNPTPAASVYREDLVVTSHGRVLARQGYLLAIG